MKCVVGYFPTRDVEAHMQLCIYDVRLKGDADGFVDVVFLERLVAEVPDAVPELCARGVDRLERYVKVRGRVFACRGQRRLCRADLQRRACQVWTTES